MARISDQYHYALLPHELGAVEDDLTNRWAWLTDFEEKNFYSIAAEDPTAYQRLQARIELACEGLLGELDRTEVNYPLGKLTGFAKGIAYPWLAEWKEPSHRMDRKPGCYRIYFTDVKGNGNIPYPMLGVLVRSYPGGRPKTTSQNRDIRIAVGLIQRRLRRGEYRQIYF